MDNAERAKLKKLLDKQIAKIKLPVEGAKEIKRKIVTKVDDIIDIGKTVKKTKIKKQINKIIDDKTVPDKTIENVEKVIDKKIESIVDKKIVKKTKRSSLEKCSKYKDTKILYKGLIVKLSNGYERFWVIIQKINKNTIVGIIDNKLIHPINGKNYGDVIIFKLANIYDVYNG